MSLVKVDSMQIPWSESSNRPIERVSLAPSCSPQPLATQVEFEAMPSTKSYRQLHGRVVAQPGAAERLVRLRKRTLVEMKEHKFQKAFRRSPEPGSDYQGLVGGSQ